jgi:Zn-finger nucleic acid-binding protein
MKCPIDTDTDLQMTERQGVEIDYCPKCRGVWLDRGELDKLIERSMSPNSAGSGSDYQGGGHHSKGYGSRKHRGGFLGDLFDF